MSTPAHQLDRDPRLYAPPWARERPLPGAGQPQSMSSPPVASASQTTEPEQTARMPRGGPNVDCPPNYRAQPEFGGDVEMLAFRRKLALEPDEVPQPPFLARREVGLPWISRLGFVLLAAGIISFGGSFMGSNELSRLTLAEHDRADVSATTGKSTE